MYLNWNLWNREGNTVFLTQFDQEFIPVWKTLEMLTFKICHDGPADLG